MTNIQRGAVLRTAGAYDKLRTGTLQVGTTPVPLVDHQFPVLEVIVQNDPGGQVDIYIGNINRQDFVIIAGANLTIPINDLNNVYVRSDSGTVTVNWLAME